VIVDLGLSGSPFVARLLAEEGFEHEAELALLLPEGAAVAARPGAGVAVRTVTSDADRAAVLAMTRADHLEEAEKAGDAVRDEEVTRALVDTLWRKAPRLEHLLALVDGEPAGFFSWFRPVDGVGLVEDLYTSPAARGRGVAAALVVEAVDRSRRAGAGPVLIGAAPDDWPQRWYRRAGFAPFGVRWFVGRRGRG
jgi:GNAT superfamily N-acetyltransferase